MDWEELQIRAVVDCYVAGFNRGDKELLLQALHSRFVSSGFFQGELQWIAERNSLRSARRRHPIETGRFQIGTWKRW
jgi:hypothetical protein